ncbi:MAG: DUF6531 domain-containing protein [Chloroflexia bacterium]
MASASSKNKNKGNQMAGVVATPPADAIVVDDGDGGTPGSTFTRNGCLPPPRNPCWWERFDPTYYDNDMWYTFNSDLPGPINVGTWRTPPLTVTGIYTVVAHIPLYFAQTIEATYRISHASGTNTYVVNQAANRGRWVELGAYPYNAGDHGQVALDDLVPEVILGEVRIGYDAMIWLPPGVGWGPPQDLAPYDARWANLGWRWWMGYRGDPVSTAFGSFYTQHQDLRVPGRQLDVNFTRVYNSLDTRVGSFGLGWHYTYDMSAIDRGDGSIIVTFGDGRAGLYLPDGGGYTTPDGFFAELTNDGGQRVLTDVDQTVYRFNMDGTLARISEPNGSQINFAYDPSGYNLTDTVGRVFRVDMNTDGFITEITDPIGRTYTYDYSDNRLMAFHDAMGGMIEYGYNGDDLLESVTDPNNHIFVTNTYDTEGRVIEQLDAAGSSTTFAYQISPTITTITDNEGNQTVHEFDSDYRLIRETDALGQSMIYDYDNDNNRTYVKDRGNHETFMQYDTHGNMTQQTDALSQVSVWQYDAHNNLTLERNTNSEETTYFYDARDNLERIHDAEGGDTVMTYDVNGQMVTLRDANMHLTQLTYDSQGNLATVLDALNNTTSYTYDSVGRRLTMMDDNGHITQSAYDANDRVITITDPKNHTTQFVYDAVGNLLSFTDRRGFTTHYTYNVNDSLIQLVDPRNSITTYTYDLMYNRTSETNGRGYTTSYEYDAVYNQTRVVDAKGNDTQFVYNPDYLVVQQSDTLNNATDFEYDALHRLVRVTDALGGITQYEYDPVGRRTLLYDARGGVTHFEYDALGRLIEVIDALNGHTTSAYDAVGNRTSVTNARNITTISHYDAMNRLLDHVDPLGTLVQFTYDGVGNVVTQTDARGNATGFQYDENDNVIQALDALNGVTSYTYDAEDNRLTVTDANNHTRAYTYDQVGNLLSSMLPLGQVTTNTYDENSNLLSITNAKNNTTNFTYDELDLLSTKTTPLGFVTSYEYDEIQRIERMIDAENHATRYEYDALGRLTKVIDALNGQTRYEYDPLGDMTAYVDANNHQTDYVVDLLSRVTRETDPLTHAWNYTYDGVGNRTARVDANGITTSYTYDARNRLTRTAYSTGPGVDYTYDGNGNMTSLADVSGAATYTYDALNRLTESRRTSGIMAGRVLGYQYDAVGNRTRVTYPDGRAVSYSYDANDWLISTLMPLAGATSYTLDPVGLPTHMQNPNGTWTDYSYDRDDRLTRLFNGKPDTSSNVVSSFDYTMDRVGNRTRTVEKVARGQVVTWDKSYAYDALYRLTGSVFTPNYNPAQVLTSDFTYDAVGNRLSMRTNISDRPNTPPLPAPVTTLYSYDNANQMLTAGATQYTYDLNGNRTSMLSPTRAINYAYDFENRLKGAVTYDVQRGRLKYDSTLDYTYDGLGRRLERGVIDNGVRKIADFLYDGLGYDMLTQYVSPGEPRTTNYYRDPSQVLSRHEIQGNGTGLQYFHHYDGLGDVSAWTNHAGKAVQEYMYAPYGRLIDNNGPDNSSNRTDPHNNLTWSGKPWDKETELNYFGARDYDSSTGTWLTRDEYRGEITDPMSLHRLMYVNDNPISNIDLYGFKGTLVDNDSSSVIFILPEDGDRLVPLYPEDPPTAAEGIYQNPSGLGLPQFIEAGPNDVARKFGATIAVRVYDVPGGLLWEDTSFLSLVRGLADQYGRGFLSGISGDIGKQACQDAAGKEEDKRRALCPGEGWKNREFLKEWGWPQCAVGYFCSTPAARTGNRQAADIKRTTQQNNALLKSLTGGTLYPWSNTSAPGAPARKPIVPPIPAPVPTPSPRR